MFFKFFYFTFLFIAVGLLTHKSSAQSYKVLDVVTDKFPVVEAHIINTDLNYESESYTIDSVSVFENDKSIQPLDFVLPKSIVPISLVFALDISVSMKGERFEMLKSTTKNFIKNIPVENTEIAIASFNDFVILNHDFTHRKEDLYNTIDNLKPIGSTSFSNAFLTPDVGLTDIAKKGVYKKVIIFITDGLSKVDPALVYKYALEDSITIDCISIGLPMPLNLVQISENTGGRFYSNLNTKQEINLAFHKLFNKIQNDHLGKIKWRSEYSCDPEKSTKIFIGDHSLLFNYEIPDSLVGYITVLPENISFDKGLPGDTYYESLFLQGHNIGLNVESVTNTNPSVFGLKSGTLPIISGVNEFKKIDLSFSPVDTTFVSADYTIKNTGCPDVVLEASSKGTTKLVITKPSGGEEYFAGSEIPIEWTGVPKSANVDFYYESEGKNEWIPIGSGNSLKKDWKAPVFSGRIRIKGVISNNITLSNLVANKSVIADGSKFKSAYYNKNGSEILSLSSDGTLKNWDAKTGELNHIFECPILGDYAFMPGFNRVVDISSKEVNIYTNRNGLKIKELSLGGHSNLSSLTHVKEKELYVTLGNYATLIQNSEYLDFTSSPVSYYSIGRSESELLVFKSGQKKKEFSIKLDPTFQKSILHRTQPILAVSNLNSITLYNLKSKKEIVSLNHEVFYQFSSDGNYLITNDSLHYNMYDIVSGEKVFTFDLTANFSISHDGKYIEELYNDTFKVTNILSKDILLSLNQSSIEQPEFFPMSEKILFIKKDSLIIMDLQNENIIGKVYCEPGLVKMLNISPDEKSILVMGTNAIAPFKMDDIVNDNLLHSMSQQNSDTTIYFSIVLPEPELQSKISFQKHYLHKTIENVFPDVITNKNKSSISIDSIYIESENSCFSVVSKPGKYFIDPMQKSSVEIAFTPYKAGLHTGRLIVVSGGKEYVCSLEGTGITKNFEVLTPLINFPALDIYDKTDTIVPLIRNMGTEVIHVDGIRLNPSFEKSFSFGKNVADQQLEPGDTLWLEPAFCPVKRGRLNALVELKMDDLDWIKTTDLYGDGIGKRSVVIAVQTINADTKKPLKSLVTLTALESASIAYQQYTDDNGKIEFVTNTDLNYSLNAEQDGYFSSSENIDLEGPQKEDTVRVTLELIPINSVSPVRLNNVFFESGKAELLDISIPELERIADFMRNKADVKLEIHGHTDNIGSEESNLELSKQRALAVKKYIVNQGIATERISIKYFGESRPVKDNDTPEGRKANRRVEIKFIR